MIKQAREKTSMTSKSGSVDILSGIYRRLGPNGSRFLTDDLSFDTDQHDSVQGSNRKLRGSYMGICKLPHFESMEPTKHRRLDIKTYPKSMYPFALSYFTGSDHWNRSIRYFAKKKGFSLSDQGLVAEKQCAIDYLRYIGRNEQANSTKLGHMVPGMKSERDIFDTLGLGDLYKEPHDRVGSIFPPGMGASTVNAYFRRGQHSRSNA